jgi:CarD family transcriptional regulator
VDAGARPTTIGDAELQVGARVVYPNQGVCRISGIEVKEIGGVRGEFLTMHREEDGATVMVPRSKVGVIGLRQVASPAEVEQVFEFLQTEGADPELDWKIRHRINAEKMVNGSVRGTAEVLKVLHTLSQLRPLPTKERELYDTARHLLVNEVAVAMSQSNCTAEDTIDVCLDPPPGTARAAVREATRKRRAAAAMLEIEGLEDADLDALEDVTPLPDANDAKGPERARIGATLSRLARGAAKPQKARSAPGRAAKAKVKPAKKTKPKAAAPTRKKPASGRAKPTARPVAKGKRASKPPRGKARK